MDSPRPELSHPENLSSSMKETPRTDRPAVPPVPRTLWALWLQGRDEAPGVVQACLDSWQSLNPGWDLVVLDETTVREYVDLPAILGRNAGRVSRQALADVARVNLLADHGGVWVDATCHCQWPLDDWIGSATPAGFFAFSSPGRDRLIANWFLASARSCPLTLAYREATNAYWASIEVPDRTSRVRSAAARLLTRVLSRNARLPRLWFHPLVTKGLRVSPYYWPHYLFAEVVARDSAARAVWEQTPTWSAHGPLHLKRYGLLRPPSDPVRAAVEGRQEPVYKLNWRVARDGYPPGSTLDLLLSQPHA